MAEARLYARITLDFADSAKIKPLSDKAFRQYIEALLWSRRMLSDGFIPSKMVRILFTEEALEELTTNDDDKPSLRIVEGGVEIHDFCEHQTTKAAIEKKQFDGAKGGKAKASKVAVEKISSVGLGVVEKNVAKTETETETIKTLARNEFEEEFDIFWNIYPKKLSKAQAKRAFVKVYAKSGDAILEGARRYANDPNLPEQQYIPYPATWLNGERWEDGPLPARVIPPWQAKNEIDPYAGKEHLGFDWTPPKRNEENE